MAPVLELEFSSQFVLLSLARSWMFSQLISNEFLNKPQEDSDDEERY